MTRRNCAALALALACLLLPLSACGGEAETLESRCQSALTAVQGLEGVSFTETWTLEDKGETRTLTEMAVSQSGDSWTRTIQDTFYTEEVQYEGVQYQRIQPGAWAPTAIQENDSFWQTLKVSDFHITEAAEREDGTIVLTVGGEPAEDNAGNTTQLEALEFVLSEDGSLRTCREILRLTTLSADEDALRGTLTAEVTITDTDAVSVSGAVEAMYQEASQGYADLLGEPETDAP